MKTLALVTTLVAALFAPHAHATPFAVNGTVAKVYSLDRTQWGPSDHFTLNGFTSAGSCPTNDGRIAVYFADDEGGRRQLSMVLMARAMNWTLHVRVDDSDKNTAGGCRLKVLEIEI
jgi:hypothetical protein